MTLDEELALIRQNGTSPAPAAPAQTEPPPTQPDPYGDLVPPETGLIGPDPTATQWDVFSAAFEADGIRRDPRNASYAARRELSIEMEALLPQSVRDELWQKAATANLGWETFEEQVVNAAAAQAATSADEAARWAGYPLTYDGFQKTVLDRRKAELEEAQRILDQPGGTVAEFAGGLTSGVADPVNLFLLPFGVGGSLVRTVASEAVLGAVGAGLSLPNEFRVAEELGQPNPDGISTVTQGMIGGAVVGGAFYGLAKGIQHGRNWYVARGEGVTAAMPDGVNPAEFELGVDAAEGSLRGDATVAEAMLPASSEPGTLGAIVGGESPGILPPVTPDAPPGWAEIRNGIFAGESGGDYDALFGYQNRKGGVFSRVRVTEMTVDQAIAFSDPSGRYGQWVKGQIGRVATPMGAYQIVGATLRAAKKGLGLQGDELMTPALQERLAHWIYREQGTGAWEGYRGPRSSFSPAPADGDAPRFDTSRGYTGNGQVRAGDDFTVDVQYEVVDLTSLTRASGDLQPRDRSRIASDAWIADTASRLDPAQLMPSPTADRGAPIVGPDNVIESGNGRYGAIARAYERFPDRAQAYRQQIEAAGFAVPEGVTQPVLVARRTSDLSPEDRVRFAVAAQDSGVAAMTPTEMARASGRAMTGPVLSRLDPTKPLTDAANGDFVRSALQGLPRSARNAMFDAGGMLNAAGARQLREALFARAWPDADILARFTEGNAGDLKSLLEALDAAAPSFAALKADIEAGLVRPEMDISGHVLDAMRLIAAAREVAASSKVPMAKAVQDLLEEIDLIDGAVAPLTAALVRKFWTGGKAAKAEDVAAFLTRYADEARKAGAAGGMFDAPGPRDVLVAIDRAAFGDLPEDLGNVRGFARPGDTARADEIAATPVEGFEAGAASPEAEAVRDEIRAELETPRQEASAITFVQNPSSERQVLFERDGMSITFAEMDDGVRYNGRAAETHEIRVPGLEGFIVARVHRDGTDLHVADIYMIEDEVRVGAASFNRAGPSVLRDVLRAYKGLAPGLRTVSGERVGGARFAGQYTANIRSARPVRVPISRFMDGAATDAPPAPAAQRTGGADAADEVSAEIAALREAGMDDFEVALPDGTTTTLRAALDDLDADQGFDAFIQACNITPTGATA